MGEQLTKAQKLSLAPSSAHELRQWMVTDTALMGQPELIDHVTMLGPHLEGLFTDAYGLKLV